MGETYDDLFTSLRADQQVLDLKRECFKEQLAFINDDSRFKVAVCTRRAGKSTAAQLDIIDACLRFPGVKCLYIAETGGLAKKIMWDDLLALGHRFNLGLSVNTLERFIQFKNGSKVFLGGAKDPKSIDRFLGQVYKRVYIDEMASFGPYVEDLVFKVVLPAVADEDRNPGGGQVCLIGTPGAPRGVFYEVATGHRQGWSCHGWKMDDNPHIRDPEKERQTFMMGKGVTADDPTFRREMLGEWVEDYDSLVFRFDVVRDSYAFPPPPFIHVAGYPRPIPVEWQHVMGVDLGYEDANAIIVVAFSPQLDTAYVVHEFVERKQGIKELAEKVQSLIVRYKPIRQVADHGGLGKAIVEEMRVRYGVALDVAQKEAKPAFCDLINDDLRHGRLLFDPSISPMCISDMGVVKWDDKRMYGDHRRWSRTPHSDVLDALLYAWRESLHFRGVAPISRPVPGTPSYMKQEEERMEAELEKQELLKRDDDQLWWRPDELDAPDIDDMGTW